MSKGTSTPSKPGLSKDFIAIQKKYEATSLALARINECLVNHEYEQPLFTSFVKFLVEQFKENSPGNILSYLIALTTLKNEEDRKEASKIISSLVGALRKINEEARKVKSSDYMDEKPVSDEQIEEDSNNFQEFTKAMSKLDELYFSKQELSKDFQSHMLLLDKAWAFIYRYIGEQKYNNPESYTAFSKLLSEQFDENSSDTKTILVRLNRLIKLNKNEEETKDLLKIVKMLSGALNKINQEVSKHIADQYTQEKKGKQGEKFEEDANGFQAFATALVKLSEFSSQLQPKKTKDKCQQQFFRITDELKANLDSLNTNTLENIKQEFGVEKYALRNKDSKIKIEWDLIEDKRRKTVKDTNDNISRKMNSLLELSKNENMQEYFKDMSSNTNTEELQKLYGAISIINNTVNNHAPSKTLAKSIVTNLITPNLKDPVSDEKKSAEPGFSFINISNNKKYWAKIYLQFVGGREFLEEFLEDQERYIDNVADFNSDSKPNPNYSLLTLAGGLSIIDDIIPTAKELGYLGYTETGGVADKAMQRVIVTRNPNYASPQHIQRRSEIAKALLRSSTLSSMHSVLNIFANLTQENLKKEFLDILFEDCQQEDGTTKKRIEALVNEKDNIHLNSLIQILIGHRENDRVRTLLEIKPDLINELNEDNYNPLHTSAESNNPAIIGLLLAKGVDINAQSEKRGIKDKTALHIAAVGGHVKVVMELLKHGADLSIKDSKGQTPLQIANAAGKRDVVIAIVKYYKEQLEEILKNPVDAKAIKDWMKSVNANGPHIPALSQMVDKMLTMNSEVIKNYLDELAIESTENKEQRHTKMLEQAKASVVSKAGSATYSSNPNWVENLYTAFKSYREKNYKEASQSESVIGSLANLSDLHINPANNTTESLWDSRGVTQEVFLSPAANVKGMDTFKKATERSFSDEVLPIQLESKGSEREAFYSGFGIDQLLEQKQQSDKAFSIDDGDSFSLDAFLNTDVGESKGNFAADNLREMPVFRLQEFLIAAVKDEGENVKKLFEILLIANSPCSLYRVSARFGKRHYDAKLYESAIELLDERYQAQARSLIKRFELENQQRNKVSAQTTAATKEANDLDTIKRKMKGFNYEYCEDVAAKLLKDLNVLQAIQEKNMTTDQLAEPLKIVLDFSGQNFFDQAKFESIKEFVISNLDQRASSIIDHWGRNKTESKSGVSSNRPKEQPMANYLKSFAEQRKLEQEFKEENFPLQENLPNKTDVESLDAIFQELQTIRPKNIAGSIESLKKTLEKEGSFSTAQLVEIYQDINNTIAAELKLVNPLLTKVAATEGDLRRVTTLQTSGKNIQTLLKTHFLEENSQALRGLEPLFLQTLLPLLEAQPNGTELAKLITYLDSNPLSKGIATDLKEFLNSSNGLKFGFDDTKKTVDYLREELLKIHLRSKVKAGLSGPKLDDAVINKIVEDNIKIFNSGLFEDHPLSRVKEIQEAYVAGAVIPGENSQSLMIDFITAKNALSEILGTYRDIKTCKSMLDDIKKLQSFLAKAIINNSPNVDQILKETTKKLTDLNGLVSSMIDTITPSIKPAQETITAAMAKEDFATVQERSDFIGRAVSLALGEGPVQEASARFRRDCNKICGVQEDEKDLPRNSLSESPDSLRYSPSSSQGYSPSNSFQPEDSPVYLHTPEKSVSSTTRAFFEEANVGSPNSALFGEAKDEKDSKQPSELGQASSSTNRRKTSNTHESIVKSIKICIENHNPNSQKLLDSILFKALQKSPKFAPSLLNTMIEVDINGNKKLLKLIEYASIIKVNTIVEKEGKSILIKEINYEALASLLKLPNQAIDKEYLLALDVFLKSYTKGDSKRFQDPQYYTAVIREIEQIGGIVEKFAKANSKTRMVETTLLDSALRNIAQCKKSIDDRIEIYNNAEQAKSNYEDAKTALKAIGCDFIYTRRDRKNVEELSPFTKALDEQFKSPTANKGDTILGKLYTASSTAQSVDEVEKLIIQQQTLSQWLEDAKYPINKGKESKDGKAIFSEKDATKALEAITKAEANLNILKDKLEALKRNKEKSSGSRRQSSVMGTPDSSSRKSEDTDSPAVFHIQGGISSPGSTSSKFSIRSLLSRKGSKIEQYR